jgi:hypothetical protein
MIWGALVLLVALCLAGCSTRSVVVAPDQLSTLHDSKWTIKSEPR